MFCGCLFLGNSELMTIGFFSYDENHGVILTQITPNTALNRRLFWHYWPRDNISEIKHEHFNTKWTVLEKVYLSKMDCPLIGELIVEWLGYDNHAVYELGSNNCQHFVRDFVAPLDVKIAKRLSSSFDVKIVKSMIPAGVIAEGIDAEAKCNNINRRLWPIIERYQEESKQQREEKKNVNDFDVVLKNFDAVANALGMSLSSSEEEIDESLEKDQDSLKIYKDKLALNKEDEHKEECDDIDEMKLTVSNSIESIETAESEASICDDLM